MGRLAIRATIVSTALLTLLGTSLLAGPNRVNSIERFGIGGFIQPIGLHHGFHIEIVVPGSAAEKDKFRPHDVIVKVNGEPIRSIDHLRADLAEAFADDGEVVITSMREGSLTHQDVRCNVKKAVPAKKTAKKMDDDADIEIK
jgi:S1-C subfamily serine protease